MTTSTVPFVQTEPLFREEQRFRGVLEWACIAGGFAAALLPVAAPLYERMARGERLPDAFTDEIAGMAVISGIALVVMGGIAMLFARAVLAVEVRPGVLLVRFRGLLVDREIPLADIEHAEAVTYSPLKEYGGWGLRYGSKGKAYNVSGRRGVRLTLAGGETLLIGSQRADELAAALRQAGR